jgi:hypothetical protein
VDRPSAPILRVHAGFAGSVVSRFPRRRPTTFNFTSHEEQGEQISSSFILMAKVKVVSPVGRRVTSNVQRWRPTLGGYKGGSPPSPRWTGLDGRWTGIWQALDGRWTFSVIGQNQCCFLFGGLAGCINLDFSVFEEPIHRSPQLVFIEPFGIFVLCEYGRGEGYAWVW